MRRPKVVRSIRMMGLAAITLAAGAVAPQARAVSLSLQFDGSPNVFLGIPFSVDVMLADLGESEVVRSYDLDVVFQEPLLDFLDVVFDGFLGAAGANPVQVEQSEGQTADGVVDLASNSFLPSSTLEGMQPGSFRLAQIVFLPQELGDGNLCFSQTVVGGIGGVPLTVGETSCVGVNVLVPEAGTLWLVALGAGLAGYARKLVAS
jgi:hypothetical protein